MCVLCVHPRGCPIGLFETVPLHTPGATERRHVAERAAAAAAARRSPYLTWILMTPRFSLVFNGVGVVSAAIRAHSQTAEHFGVSPEDCTIVVAVSSERGTLEPPRIPSRGQPKTSR